MNIHIADQENGFDGEYDTFIGQRTGIIHSVGIESDFRSDSSITTSYAIANEVNEMIGSVIDGTNRVSRSGIEAGGKGGTAEQAYYSAIGEAIERYCLRFPVCESEDIVEATHNELVSQGYTVPPFEYLDIWNREQFENFGEKYSEFTRDTTDLWAPGTNLLTGETVYVPATRASFNVWSNENETPLYPATSNGVAAGPNMAFALLNSLYELVERDGFMKAWVRQETPPPIPLKNYPNARQYIETEIETDVMEVEVFSYDAAVDIPCVGAAAVNNRDKNPKFVLGGGSDVDLVEAIKDASIECAQGIPYIAELLHHVDLEDLDPAAQDSFKSNPAYYALPENFSEANCFLGGEPTDPEHYLSNVDWSTERCLKRTLEKFEEANITPIGFDLTTSDAREGGINVTRVIAPELVPITPSSTLPTEHPAFDGETVGEELTTKPHPSP